MNGLYFAISLWILDDSLMLKIEDTVCGYANKRNDLYPVRPRPLGLTWPGHSGPQWRRRFPLRHWGGLPHSPGEET